MSVIAEHPVTRRAELLGLSLAALVLLAAGFWSSWAGGHILDWASHYMATGDNTPHRDFLTPAVYALLFLFPLRLLFEVINRLSVEH